MFVIGLLYLFELCVLNIVILLVVALLSTGIVLLAALCALSTALCIRLGACSLPSSVELCHSSVNTSYVMCLVCLFIFLYPRNVVYRYGILEEKQSPLRSAHVSPAQDRPAVADKMGALYARDCGKVRKRCRWLSASDNN